MERKIYYYPYYCYRCCPHYAKGLTSIVNALSDNWKVKIYEDINKAIQAGREMLSDDDTFGILALDNTHGFIEVYEYFHDTGRDLLDNAFKKKVEIIVDKAKEK